MDIKLATESVVKNPANLSYAMIGVTTLILGYFTMFDSEPNANSEQPKEPTPTQAESNKPSFLNMLSDDKKEEPYKKEEPSLFDKFSKEFGSENRPDSEKGPDSENKPSMFEKLSDSIMPGPEEKEKEGKEEPSLLDKMRETVNPEKPVTGGKKNKTRNNKKIKKQQQQNKSRKH